MSNHRVGLFLANIFSIAISFLISYLSRFGWDPSDVAFRHLKDTTVFLYLLLSFFIVMIHFSFFTRSIRRVSSAEARSTVRDLTDLPERST